jgi:hypothetical protein
MIGTTSSEISDQLRDAVEGQKLPTLTEHLSSPRDFSGVRVAQSLVFCVVFCISLSFFFVSDYPFGVFKLFL